MTELEMMRTLEEARQISVNADNAVYAMSNGSRIKVTQSLTKVDELKNAGYWTCSIFRDGHRCEA